MNNLDKQYTDFLQDIIDNGVRKEDRTGTGTLSVFGRQIRHKMSEGFPLLTTKKMAWKTMVTELLWFLRGDTDVRFLWGNNCSIWDGDWYKKYKTTCSEPYTLEEVKQKVKEGNHNFHDSMFDMGPIYGRQWRNWKFTDKFTNGEQIAYVNGKIDQIANSLNLLKTDPDSRRNKVSAWNVGEMDQMTLPPCHTDFQFYTRELSREERIQFYYKRDCGNGKLMPDKILKEELKSERTVKMLDKLNIPTRAISLMWNQRSVDTFLGLPFNIASYGLLLEIIAKEVNMVPDELIGNLGDTHLYLNHIEQAKEQIGRELSLEERKQIFEDSGYVCDVWPFNGDWNGEYDGFGIPRFSREPYPLPTLKHMKTDEFYKSLSEDLSLFTHLDNTDFIIENYQSHPTIKAPLSN